MLKPICALAALLLSVSVNATTFIMKTDDQKIVESTRICAVEVLNVSAYKPKKRIFAAMTAAEVKPIECFKDPTSKNFKVIWPGGMALDDNGKETQNKVIVPGTPDLTVGQKAVLYLWRESPNSDFVVHSWINGVTNIEWSDSEKDYILKNRADDRPRKNLKASRVSGPSDRTLKGFRAKVHAVLGSQNEKK